jgi:hypothetical protein
MWFYYKGKMFKPFKSWRRITRGKSKGQIEVTFKLYGKETKATVYPAAIRGVPELETEKKPGKKVKTVKRGR